MDRTITTNEVAVIRWLLDHAAVGDVAPYRLRPLEELRVLEGCQCGCSSLDFQPNAWDTSQAGIIADAFAIHPDNQQAGLILWGRDGEVTLLEVYDCHPNASHRFPEISDLRSLAEGWTVGER